MLSITLEAGEFAMVGESILRITEVRDGCRVRLAIEAPAALDILRFTKDGQACSLHRRIMARRTSAQDPDVPEGNPLLVLRCGHEITVSASSVPPTLLVIDCPHCLASARKMQPLIQAVFDKTSRETQRDRLRGFGKQPLGEMRP